MSSTNQTLNFGFSPVAGIQWVETWGRDDLDFLQMEGFSPVAGIQWVETQRLISNNPSLFVSVPLPGFSGLRLFCFFSQSSSFKCFSPVAGIQWVETKHQHHGGLLFNVSVPLPGFSGLRHATEDDDKGDRFPVSVPLPGFSGLRLLVG